MRGGFLGAASRMVLGMVLGIGPSSCGPSAFACSSDAQCLAASAGGMCQESGLCSFPDDDCASGQRYGDYAGALTNKCVPPATADTDNPGTNDDDDDDDDPDSGSDDDDDTGTPSETGSGSSAGDGGGVTNLYDPCDEACDGFCVGIDGGEVCTLVCDLAAPDCPVTAVLPSGDYPLTCVNFFSESVCGVLCALDTDCPQDATCREPFLFGEGICLYDALP